MLFTDGSVVIADHGNPVFQTATPPASWRMYRAPSRTISTRIPVRPKVFDELGLQRRIRARLYGLACLPLLVTGTDMFALVPRMRARHPSVSSRAGHGNRDWSCPRYRHSTQGSRLPVARMPAAIAREPWLFPEPGKVAPGTRHCSCAGIGGFLAGILVQDAGRCAGLL